MRKIDISKELFLKEYNKGLNDVELSKVFNCTCCTIANRRKDWNLDSNFEYTQAISKKELKKYVDQELSDYQIADITGINHSWIFQLRKKYNLKHRDLKSNKLIKLTNRQEEVLIGHILGDGHLREGAKNIGGNISQGVKQKEYAKWKHKELQNLCGELKERIRNKIDIRTGIYYTSYDATIKTNPSLNKYYPLFYNNKKKYISKEIMDLFTPLSLAVLFMDDGYKTGVSYNIATNCFSIEDINLLQDKLAIWGIETTIQSCNKLYIKAASKYTFVNLIKPYIIPSMEYKLHKSHVTP